MSASRTEAPWTRRYGRAHCVPCWHGRSFCHHSRSSAVGCAVSSTDYKRGREAVQGVQMCTGMHICSLGRAAGHADRGAAVPALADALGGRCRWRVCAAALLLHPGERRACSSRIELIYDPVNAAAATVPCGCDVVLHLGLPHSRGDNANLRTELGPWCCLDSQSHPCRPAHAPRPLRRRRRSCWPAAGAPSWGCGSAACC